MVVLVSLGRPRQSLAIGQFSTFGLPCTTRTASGGGASATILCKCIWEFEH